MNASNQAPFGPQIAEPTEREVENTIDAAREKYGIVLPRDEAARFAKLREELGWWLTVEKHLKASGNVTEAIAKEFQAFVSEQQGREITLENALLEAEKSVAYTVPREKERIANEIRKIIAKYQEN